MGEMNDRKFTDNKKEYIDLLLLADEQEDILFIRMQKRWKIFRQNQNLFK